MSHQIEIKECLRRDFDQYQMGQLTVKKIMQKRNMSKHQVERMLTVLVAERIMNFQKQKEQEQNLIQPLHESNE